MHVLCSPNWEHPRAMVSGLEKLVLEGHVRLGLKADTGAENVGHSSTLLGKSIHNGSARRGQRSLEHIAKDAQNTVEVLVVTSVSTVGRRSLPLDTGHHLSHNNEIDDQGRGEQRIFTDVKEPA